MINQVEVASRSREHVTHQLFLDEQGKAIGCTCETRQFNRASKACFHMSDWNMAAQEKALTESIAQYRAIKEQRDQEEYAKRVAWLESQKRNITTVDLVPHVEDDLRSQYEGCSYCGKNHKSWNCPF